MDPIKSVQKLKAAGWTYTAIARSVGVTTMTLSRIRKNDAPHLSFKTVLALYDLAKKAKRRLA